jgi:hypothetical protein
MRTKSSRNLWEDTATNPKKPEWQYIHSNKVSRKKFNRKSPESKNSVQVKRVLPAPNPNVIITKSNFTLASLGLSFAPSYG